MSRSRLDRGVVVDNKLNEQGSHVVMTITGLRTDKIGTDFQPRLEPKSAKLQN